MRFAIGTRGSSIPIAWTRRLKEREVNPEDLCYTPEHEWARADGDRVTVGITHYAQKALGDVVYVDLPAAGTRVEKGQPFGEVESTKSVSDLYAPVTGTIIERNESLESHPELVNTEPYGEGWIVVIKADDLDELSRLLSAEDYTRITEPA
jgi:glycine cleavage system H protein